ncbi:MAG: stage V sporulation protein E [Patescibacteria group bacterium]
MAKLTEKIKSIDEEIEKKSSIDKILLIAILTLNVLGLIFVLSSSLPHAQSLVEQGVINSVYFFFTKQLKSTFFAWFALFAGFLIPIKFYKKFSLPAFFGILFALFLVVFPLSPFRTNLNTTAFRWLNLGFITFQPSEIGKFIVIIYLATWFDSKGKDIKSFSFGFIPFLILAGILSGLIILQPDLGTLIVIFAISVIIFFVAGANISHLIFMASLASLAFYYAVLNSADNYRLARFRVWTNPEEDPTGAGHQIYQSLLAIGSGGSNGVGLGRSKQAFFIPEAFSDGIFTIIGEELGFVKILAFVFLAYGVFIWRGFEISKNIKNKFAMLVAIGITSWIAVQMFINIASFTSLIPMTGVPLPFISFGGSSLLVLMFASGVLLNLSQYREK